MSFNNNSNSSSEIKIITASEFQEPFRQAVRNANNQTWSRNLKNCEEELGITGISNWINKKRNFDLVKMLRILKYFDIEFTMKLNFKIDKYSKEKSFEIKIKK